jgi:hypothetical protein
MLMGIGPYRLRHQWINYPNIDLYGLVSALPSLSAQQVYPILNLPDSHCAVSNLATGR